MQYAAHLSHLEPEVCRKASALMVTPDEMHLRRVCHLQRKKVQQHLARKFSSVHVVPQKQIATHARRNQASHRGGRTKREMGGVRRAYSQDNAFNTRRPLAYSPERPGRRDMSGFHRLRQALHKGDTSCYYSSRYDSCVATPNRYAMGLSNVPGL